MNQNKFLETIKVFDGKIYNLSYHQKRYESVLNFYNISKFHNLQDFIKPPLEGLYRCRLIYSIENLEDITVTFHPYTKKKISSLKIISDESIEYSQKYLNRDKLNELYELKGSGDDILIIKNSLITDTSIANIAFFKDDQWLTPSKPLLHGTTRQRYLDEGKIILKDIQVKDLHSFTKVALLNAMVDFDIITNISYKY